MRGEVPLPITPEADPNAVSLEDAVQRIEAEEELSAADKTSRLAATQGNLAEAMDQSALTELGIKCCEEYDRDKEDRKEWAQIAEDALKSASQEEMPGEKTFPWPNSSNVNVPLLTTAALQFNARMYPAVVKGDEAILCKVIGKDEGKPVMGPNPQTGQMQPIPQMTQGPEGQMVPVQGPDGKLVPQWQVEPGAKTKRASRVSEYLNTVVFYRMTDWESDTDALLMQLPIVGCVFRKVWTEPRKGVQSAMVPALRLLVPQSARDLKTTPRITEELPDVYPHIIRQRMYEGYYSTIDLTDMRSEDKKIDDGPRLLLEQHRLMDLDEDGLEEPYIVTVDHSTQQVLRVEPNFSPESIRTDETGKVVEIEAGQFYVKYGMFPHPEGKFYDIGLGHLLKRLGKVVDTMLNQLIDAGTAQVAGGGFIGAGVRLQGRGQRGIIRMLPGEYKTVDVTGDQLRSNIVERTLPNVSAVTFQVLDFIMGFAREIGGAKDVLTGEASNSAPVGSTLALIEQGLQVFNAVAKRYFRAAKGEYTLIFDNIRKYGGERAAQDYQEVLDEQADFASDFTAKDMDIRPVSDPSTVTRMQKLAKAQVIQQSIPILSAVGGDPREALRRSFEAADIEDIDKLLPPPPPPDPKADMMMQLEARKAAAKAGLDEAGANKAQVDAAVALIEGQERKYQLQRQIVADGASIAANG